VFRFQREEFKKCGDEPTGVRMYDNYIEHKYISSSRFAFPCMPMRQRQQLVMRRLQKFFAPDYTRLQKLEAKDDPITYSANRMLSSRLQRHDKCDIDSKSLYRGKANVTLGNR
jgi:hypothetical protein